MRTLSNIPHLEHKKFVKELEEAYMALPETERLQLKNTTGSDVPGTYFLGTRGGNAYLMQELLPVALKAHIEFRKMYHPEDPDYLTKEVMQSEEYKQGVEMLKTQHEKLVKSLQKSGPFFSPRSIGHMLWDTSVPAMLGYFAALLYNQNNVAAEASPVTTVLELLVGNDLCEMLGFKTEPIHISNGNGSNVRYAKNKDEITGWGHITCDGSVANLEGLWAGRNVKFFAVSLKNAILNENELNPAQALKVKLLNGEEAVLIELDNWTLLNLDADEVLTLPAKMQEEFGIDVTLLGDILENYNLQNVGLLDFYNWFLPDISEAPKALGPTTMHYSWPKNGAILGIGSNNIISVNIDNKARMDIKDLDYQLNRCLLNKVPVTTVIAVIGSTEESAVDPLEDILELREKYRQKGLNFTVHADAAWGGYFASMLRKGEKDTKKSVMWENGLPMSDYVTRQYEMLAKVDSITIDPHKAGYVPYPAGGLCYRNSAMRGVVTFTAPVVYHGGFDPTVGVYGVEGSKPGAAASAVYLSHRVIRTDMTGYGSIMADCMYGAKQFYASMITLNLLDKPFKIVPLCQLPAEREGKSEDEVRAQLEFIKKRIVGKSKEELIQDKEAFELFRELGQDQTILTYIFNFKNPDGTWNDNTALANQLNQTVYENCSFSPGEKDINKTKLIITASEFEYKAYGPEFMEFMERRLGLENPDGLSINFNISTLMNPWLTETERGSFAPAWAALMAEEVEEVVHQITGVKKETQLDKLEGLAMN